MNKRKLLLNEPVEVRQFKEGLCGSWNTGVVVGISNLCRSIAYDNLLCETGGSKLVESVSVSNAIEGLHTRRHVSTTYRGHIRPRPPPSQHDSCKYKLHFGVCVDVFFEDAWWEGVVFDYDDKAKERSVFFPDKDEECKFSVSLLRISKVWDEFLDVWTDRGVWVLVELVKELEENVSVLNFIKEVWSHMRLNYGFRKMISEWTCGARAIWRQYYREVVNASILQSSSRSALYVNQSHPTTSFEDFGENIRKDMSLNRGKRKRREIPRGFRQSDQACMVCHHGGDLIPCDHCLSSYHLCCLGIEDVPNKNWFCPSCSCGLCGLRYSRSDNQKLTNVCLQCTLKYHVNCLSKEGFLLSTDYPSEKFCCEKCYQLLVHLQKMMGILNPTGVDGLTWTVLRWARNDCTIADISRTDIRRKLSLALDLIHECFEPVTQSHTRRDLVRDVVFSSASKLKRLDYRGFFVMILQRGDEFVSVATIRILGHKVAEMPLVATSFKYRRKGMCRLLVCQLEKMLMQMGVERLILPAISQLRETWETSFGFTEMPPSERLKFLGYPFLVFHGTVMLQKYLHNSGIKKDRNGSSTELKRNKSIVSHEVEAEPYKMGKSCDFTYKGQTKSEITGKENIAKRCRGTALQTHMRRRILASRV